ncbi:MAG: TlpA disulfide reductase family protein [Planctomycetota bacterium]
MIELSRSFECVYVEIGKNRALTRKHLAARLDVLMLSPQGRELARYTPPGPYDSGDAVALSREMSFVLAERARREPRAIPLPSQGRELIGTQVEPWKPDRWLQGAVGSIADLRGKVVLIRFFADTDPYAKVSLPALEKLHRKYRDRGLATVGFYHPKVRGHLERAVMENMERWGITFPVALDMKWKTVNAYWREGKQRRATAASFLVDRKGSIRYIHPGPELHPGKEGCNLAPESCNRDFAELEAAVRILLGE